MQEMINFKAYVPNIELITLVPFLALIIGAILCLVTDAATDKEGSRKFLPIIALVSLALSGFTFLLNLIPHTPFVENAFRGDEFSQLGGLVIIFSALVATAMAPKLIEKRNLPCGEFYALTLFATFGMVTLAAANELLTAFICLEILSLSLYILAGIDRKSPKATEASFKYFILGAFASAFLVMGIAFLYGATHTTELYKMASIFNGTAAYREVVPVVNPLWVYLGFALMLVGICFKLSLAPFHMYAPDLYEGANTPTTMFIATGSKVAALAFLVHLVEPISQWLPYAEGMLFIVGFVAVTSMIWGNLGALVQTNIKRMLAYSSIAHTGYATVGVLVLLALPSTGLRGEYLMDAQEAVRLSLILYMAGYTVMNVVAFGIAQYIGGEGNMSSYRGLVHRSPMAAFAMAVAMFSLLGIPPTVGFMGKFWVFKEAVQHGFTGIAIIGVLASVISAFYYLNLVVTMFMRSEEDESAVEVTMAGGTGTGLRSGLHGFILVAAVILIFLFGVLPTWFFALNYSLGTF